MPIGYPDFGGTPLVHGFTRVYASTNPVLGSNTTFTDYIKFDRPGYIVNVRPQFQAANGTSPFAQIALDWVDANPATIDLYNVTHTIKVNPAGIYSPVLGQGPVRGQYCKLVLTNLAVGQNIVFAADFWETTHHIARDDWRDSEVNGFNPPPGYTAPPINSPARGVLGGGINTAIGAGATVTYILPLYVGQVVVRYKITSGAGPVTVTLNHLVTFDGSLLELWDDTLSSTFLGTGHTFNFPRAHCFISFNNTGGASTNVSWDAIILEFAS